MYESGPARYSKEELLNIARHQKSRGDPSRLFMQDWNPHVVNGHHSSRGWGKSSETHVPQEPGACWDANGDTLPMGLQDYTTEEREVRFRRLGGRTCSVFANSLAGFLH
jgi:PERQ amino acid-rich with GYF domain-containing protein